MRKLFESNSYVLESEYEVVFLRNKITGETVVVGDHYGDPTCGYISDDETHCISCGAGVIVYFMRNVNLPYSYDKQESQWVEFHRNEMEIAAINYENNDYVFYDEDGRVLDIRIEIDRK